MISYEIALFLSAIATIIFLIIAMKTKMKHKSIGLGFLFIVYLTIVICLTLFPIIYAEKVYFPEGTTWYNLQPFKIISQIFIYGIEGASAAQIIGNIIMTMPFGIFVILFLREPKWWKLLLCAIGFSVSIEIAQYIIGIIINNMYRIIDIDDVILNVTGTYAGYSLYYLYNSKIKYMLRGKKKRKRISGNYSIY